jgi:phosphoribosyl 1,2-cyclic phosphate phosphodiesterase
LRRHDARSFPIPASSARQGVLFLGAAAASHDIIRAWPPPRCSAASVAPLRATFLGTGTSTGIPMIGCRCPVCTSSDRHNSRTRSSLVVNVGGAEDATKNLLVDTTPEMRLQMLATDTRRVEAVLVTHTHADHIFGMDDIRQINFRHDIAMPILGTPETLERLALVFDYCFKETQTGGGKPRLTLSPIRPYEPFDLLGVTITPLVVLHGSLPVIAYKFGSRFAYVTDVSHIPDETRPHLKNLDTLVIGTCATTRTRPTSVCTRPSMR